MHIENAQLHHTCLLRVTCDVPTTGSSTREVKGALNMAMNRARVDIRKALFLIIVIVLVARQLHLYREPLGIRFSPSLGSQNFREMAEIATVIIKVDLHCRTCSKKIKKALCKLQNRFNIQSIVYDEKNNTVTVSGPFNPECFIKKLRCLACKVIKDVQIKPKPPPPPPPKAQPPKPEPPPPPKPEKPPPPPPEVVVKLPVCVFPPPGWPVCCYQPCPCFEPRNGCRRCCTCGWICDVPSLPQPRPKPVPLPEAGVRPPVCFFPPLGWPNCCRQPCPCFEPLNGCRRCCSCGWVCNGAPPSAACRPGCEVDGCKIIVEQEPCQSCSIM